MSKGTLETDEAILGLFIDFLSILDVVFLHEALLLKVYQNRVIFRSEPVVLLIIYGFLSIFETFGMLSKF